jgi:hypothetical protein
LTLKNERALFFAESLDNTRKKLGESSLAPYAHRSDREAEDFSYPLTEFFGHIFELGRLHSSVILLL